MSTPAEIVDFAERLVGPLYPWQRDYLLTQFSPAGVAPVASVGGSTSSVDQSSPVLATLDALPRHCAAGVLGLPEPEPAARAAVGEPQLPGRAS